MGNLKVTVAASVALRPVPIPASRMAREEDQTSGSCVLAKLQSTRKLAKGRWATGLGREEGRWEVLEAERDASESSRSSCRDIEAY